MKNYYHKTEIEVGIDEAGRGSLAGPIFAAAVIWPKNKDLPGIMDSKKLTSQKRKELRELIEKYAIDYCVAYIDNNEIDKINIGVANMKVMHQAISGINTKFETILVDGNHFKPYPNQLHRCFVGGDNKFTSIACASILAKTYHDDYVEKICTLYPKLNDYDWLNNMCYGTEKHLNAIKKYGITKYHRRSYGNCKTAPLRSDINYNDIQSNDPS
jgi:ribonuclease HII